MFEFVAISPGLVPPHSFMGSLSGIVIFKKKVIHHFYCVSHNFYFSAKKGHHYLQPVINTTWAIWSVHALDVEVVSKVKSHSESRFYRNNVLTGQSLRWRVRVCWTEQMSLWFIKYTSTTGYCI